MELIEAMFIRIDTGCSIFQHGKNKDLWYARFRDKRKRPKQKDLPLDTKDKIVAISKAAELCGKWKRGNWDPWNDIDLYVTVEEAIKYFERERASEIKSFDGNVWILREVCKAGEITFLRALSPAEIRKVIWQRDLSPATRNSYFNKLSAILSWYVQKGYLAENPLDEVLKPPVYKGKPKYYTGSELEALLTAGRLYLEFNEKYTHRKQLYPDWFIDAFELEAFTGMRKMDTPNLCWGDVRFPEGDEIGSITIRLSKRTQDRVITLLPHTEKLLRRLEAKTRVSTDPFEPVLKGPDGKKAISGSFLSRKFTRVQQFAKLKPIGLHGLRHTFAVMLVFAGVHIRAIQKQMAHKDISTTMKYTELSNEDVLKLTYEKFI